MSITVDLLDGLTAMTVAATIAVSRPDGTPYLPTETGISYKNLPPTPDRMLSLTPYGATGDYPNLPLGQQRIQVWGRGTSDPRDVDVLMDAVFDLWQGVTDRQFGDCHVIQILRISSIPMGQDAQSRRWERSDNYSIDYDSPATANRQ